MHKGKTVMKDRYNHAKNRPKEYSSKETKLKEHISKSFPVFNLLFSHNET